ncbi:hypothetical protein RFI_29412 [Reticulomyxa filosa]|uniref:non-specific serine/threonine protein kinase n=1 Tax=Reticulomyxa filosa TaxID=46433 RepID=X6M1F9_RETFI|nr:hypothetical protein RFI_29412 [Reticulomyxa filosa]|eukprot:ETO07978.1 hypothetical protein RFI_29412 [Reticulomyxa filosa]
MEYFVLKQMKIGSVSAKEREMCHLEVQLLEQLNHPCIVGYEESFLHTTTSETFLCVVMTYCEGGDLTNFLKSQKGKHLTEKQVQDMFVQIGLALHFVHCRNILHRDLKSQNIFIQNGQLKLGDFGISKVLTEPMEFAQTIIGTPYYMSPEVFEGKPYDFKSDVNDSTNLICCICIIINLIFFYISCVLYEIVTFNHAFNAGNLNLLAQKIIKGRFQSIPISMCSKETRELINQLLNINPSSRPDLGQVLGKMDWLKSRIRDYCVSAHQKYNNNLLSEKAYQNLELQIRKDLNMDWIFDNMEELSTTFLLKKGNKKKIFRIQQIRKHAQQEMQPNLNMEIAALKLKQERQWGQNQYKKKISKPFSNQDSKNAKLNSPIKENSRKNRHKLKQKEKDSNTEQEKSPTTEKTEANINDQMQQQSDSFVQYHFLDRKSKIQENDKFSVNDVSFLHPKTTKAVFELLLVGQKCNHNNVFVVIQNEYDILEQVRRRRELVQQRLDELKKRHIEKNEERALCSSKQDTVSSVHSTPVRSTNLIQQPLGVNSIIDDSRSEGELSQNVVADQYTEASLMNPRERMLARKRAEADARAFELRQASQSEFHSRKMQAQLNKLAVRGGAEINQQSLLKISDDLHLPEKQEVSMLCENFETKQERLSEGKKEEEEEEEEEEEHQIEDGNIEAEIEELRKLPFPKDTIAADNKVGSSIDDSQNVDYLVPEESDDSGSDIESMLVKQEKQVSAQFQQLQTHSVNEDKPNYDINDNGGDSNDNKNINDKCEAIVVVDHEEEDNSASETEPECDNSSESSGDIPTGRLADRIQQIKNQCIECVGFKEFQLAYALVKTLSFEEKHKNSQEIHEKLKKICSGNDVPNSKIERLLSLIDEILFIEANCPLQNIDSKIFQTIYNVVPCLLEPIIQMYSYLFNNIIDLI